MKAVHPVGGEAGNAAPRVEESLVRAIGVRGLAATIFNVIVGAGIFVLPAVAAAGLGAAAPLAYVACAIAMGLIVLCFAEAGSRVALTGGPYAYVEVAFGPFVGFQAGVLLWLLGTFATAAVASAFTGVVAIYWEGFGQAVPRALILLLLFATLTAVNVRGVRAGTRLVEVATIAKLLPLMLFVVIGSFFVRPTNLVWADLPEAGEVARTAIVLIFAFAGVESALLPSGEVRDPARAVPRALFIAMLGVTVLYAAIQLVAQGVLGFELATFEEYPLAAAAERIAGWPGALVVTTGAAISMFGHTSGMTLVMPRALFAFARDGFLPARLAVVDTRFRAPVAAIVIQSTIACVLASSSTFTRLAILANVSVLILYFLCCVAAWELRRRDVRAAGTPFRLPGGPAVHVLACGLIVWLLSGVSLREIGVVAGVLAVAALLFFATAARRRPGSG